MKRLLISIALTLGAVSARADGVTCDGANASKDPRKAGFIVYEIVSEGCDKGPGSTCYRQIEKDRDDCAGESAVNKVFCDNGVPSTVKVDCPPATRCHKGACR